jgi:tagatose 6-phosphate kinase
MILTVTINPLLERRYIYLKVFYKKSNRNGRVELMTGGKGINVSRQLNYLNIENLAFTFLGGNNGKLFKEILIREGINFSAIRTRSETRDASLVIDETENSVSTFFGTDTTIEESEVDEFKLKLEKIIQNSEMVVFSGSSPCSTSDSIFPFGIEKANKYDKISVCDTYGTHLKNCINARPTILHNNILETENSMNISLKTERGILDYLKFLYESGVKQAFITNESGKTYSSNFDFQFVTENPVVNCKDSTGSGDCFTAGIVYGLHHNLPYEETLAIASSLGAINATRYETCNVSANEIANIKSRIKISSIGKKIKKLNVAEN